jgi:hypothetical protein
MAVKKFVELFERLLPEGRAWEIQDNTRNLLNGISEEFGRSHDKATKFYRDFNLLNSSNLAFEHSQDYLITKSLYTNRERQKIIVDYIEGDEFEFKKAIEDFATFIGTPINYLPLPLPIEFGTFQFGDEFGDPNALGYMELLIEIELQSETDCLSWNKIRWLVEYLKPPYLKVYYSNKPVSALTPFEFGNIEFGDSAEFGGELIPCEIVN